MKERPILFSAPMVRALLDGSKTQTRRVVKYQPPEDIAPPIHVERYAPVTIDRHGDEVPGAEIFGAYDESGEWGTKCPYGEPGHHLWVRESLKADYDESGYILGYAYSADGAKVARCHGLAEWASDGMAFAHLARPGGVPSIHMPRWASRITLEITGVRAERLQDISEADAIAEGIDSRPHAGSDRAIWRVYGTVDTYTSDPVSSYQSLWESINGDGSWAANPWVWCVEFRRVYAGRREEA